MFTWPRKLIVGTNTKTSLLVRPTLKMQEVCPEVVADVVDKTNVVLSGKNHVESKC